MRLKVTKLKQHIQTINFRNSTLTRITQWMQGMSMRRARKVSAKRKSTDSCSTLIKPALFPNTMWRSSKPQIPMIGLSWETWKSGRRTACNLSQESSKMATGPGAFYTIHRNAYLLNLPREVTLLMWHMLKLPMAQASLPLAMPSLWYLTPKISLQSVRSITTITPVPWSSMLTQHSRAFLWKPGLTQAIRWPVRRMQLHKELMMWPCQRETEVSMWLVKSLEHGSNLPLTLIASSWGWMQLWLKFMPNRSDRKAPRLKT